MSRHEPEGRSEHVTVRMTKRERVWLLRAANENALSEGACLRQALTSYLAERHPRLKPTAKGN